MTLSHNRGTNPPRDFLFKEDMDLMKDTLKSISRFKLRTGFASSDARLGNLDDSRIVSYIITINDAVAKK